MLLPVLPRHASHPDWVNHTFLLHRVASGWLRDGLPPLLVDTPGGQGDPWLLFYGLGIYVPLAPLAWMLGASWAIKAGAVALHALLGHRVAQLAWHGTRSVAVAACACALVLAAVFPISDLSARGGIAEFFAYELCALAIVSLVLGWTQSRPYVLVQAMCAATLGALAHPPTLRLGALFLLPAVAAVLWALGPPRLPRGRVVVVVGASVLCLATAALYLAVVWPSLPHLGIVLFSVHHSIAYFDSTLDHPLARLSPLPLDLRVAGGPALPRLSAPSHGTLAVALGVAWVAALRAQRLARRALPAALVLAILFAAALLLSLPLWPGVDVGVKVPGVRFVAADSLPSRLLAHTQFGYRLVASQNLLLVLAAGLTFARVGERDAVGAWLATSRAGRIVLALATGVALLAAAMEARMIQATPELDGGERALAEARGDAWPTTFYSRGAFSMGRAFPVLDTAPVVVARTTRAEGDGTRRVLRTECRTPCGVITDLVPTRFLAVTVDGHPVAHEALRSSGERVPAGASREEVRRIERERRLALVLPAGTHAVEIVLLPPWVRLLSPAYVAVTAAAIAAQVGGLLAARRVRAQCRPVAVE